MEKEPTKQPQEFTPKPLDFHVGSYTVTAALDCNKILLQAYSELAGKMFQGTIEEKNLNEVDRMVFANCEGVYMMMEDCIVENRKIELSDVGDLKLPYYLAPSKRAQSQKVFEVKLKDVEINEVQRLTRKVDKLQAKCATMGVNNKILEGETKQLRAAVAQLTGELTKCNREISVLKESMARLTHPFSHKIVPELDMETVSIAKATIAGTQIATNKGVSELHPFFLTKKLEGKMSFELEIVEVGKYYIVVGVAVESLRNGGNCFTNVDSVDLNTNNGSTTYIFSEGKQTTLPTIKPENGWRIRVTVDRHEQTIQWGYTLNSQAPYQLIHKLPIPANLREKTLLPAMHLTCSNNNVVKFV